MTIARVTEISSSSKKSFEDAVEVGVERACKTLKTLQALGLKIKKSVSKTVKLISLWLK